jgi:hypothetical protein
MDISGVATPAVPDVQPTPPRDAQLETAVREASQSEPQQNNTQSESGGNEQSAARDESSTVGRNIDEHA